MFFAAEYAVWNVPWAQRHDVHFLVQNTASFWLCREPERSARFVTPGDKRTEHVEVAHYWRSYQNNSDNMPVLKSQLAPLHLCFSDCQNLCCPRLQGFLTPCTIPLRFCIAIGQGWAAILRSIFEINTDRRHLYLQLCIELRIFRFLNAIENLEGFLAASVWRS